MKLSIITPSFNHAQYVEDTIQSVLHQTGVDVEHIVIDGGSTDGTTDILRRYPHLQWISERDKGQSQAINKGFARATGDIVAWINSDDYYAENILSDVIEYFTVHPECSVLYGDIAYIDAAKRMRYILEGPSISYMSLIRDPDIIRQPSMFWRKSAMDAVGVLDEDLHVVMDFDFFIRLAKKFEYHYIPKTISFFRDYSDNKTHALMKRQALELFRLSLRYRILNVHLMKFLLGRFLDGCSDRNVFRLMMNPFRKGGTISHG